MRLMLTSILILFCATSCQGHLIKKNALEFKNNFLKKPDTLSVLVLEGRRYDNLIYKIVHLGNVENGQEQIQLLKNNKTISSILLPIADEEVKNFSLSRIEKTQKGFNISIEWGGGNYIYQRVFFFSFMKGTFYLGSLKTSNLTQTPDRMKNTRKTISPPIEISKLNILDYINNR